MPNWCSNYLQVNGDPIILEEFHGRFQNGGVEFNIFSK